MIEVFQYFGIEIQYVEIYSLEQGNIDIEMIILFSGGYGESEKIIVLMLFDIFEEQIFVKSEQYLIYLNGYSYVVFGLIKFYWVLIGVVYVVKGGGFVFGDSYSMMELGVRKYVVVISDGMGNGVRVYYESNEMIKLFEKIFEFGIDEKIVIKIINSILFLWMIDEIYLIFDFFIIDFQDVSCKFLKVGLMLSFIKWGD